MKKIIKNPIISIILGSLSMLMALLFAPMWYFWEKCPWKNWGMQILDIIIAITIICYLAFFLFKKIKNTGKNVIKVLTIIEFVLLSLIALGCIFTQFNIINISHACQIFGLALWTRGSVELFRAYYHRADSKEIYPVWYLVVSIVMVTFGTYCFANPFIENKVILWIFVGLLAVSGLILLVLGINTLSNKKKKIPTSSK